MIGIFVSHEWSTAPKTILEHHLEVEISLNGLHETDEVVVTEICSNNISLPSSHFELSEYDEELFCTDEREKELLEACIEAIRDSRT